MNNQLELIANTFSDYRICISKDNNLLEIFNPNGDDNIRVEYIPDDECAPYVLYFSYHHSHMNDEKDVIEAINDIVDGNLFSIEFFKNDINRFGGVVTSQFLQELSYAALEKHTGYYGNTRLKDVADSFRVSGWRLDKNFDAIFITDESGNISIRRLQ